MKRLLIDVNSVVPYFVCGKTTGIGRTTMELVTALNNINTQIPFNIELYSQNMKGIGGKNLKTSFCTRHFFLPNREGINKSMKYIPVKEIIAPYDLVHIPHNFEYVYKPEKTIVTLHDALFMHLNEKAFSHLKMRKQVPLLMRKCKGLITCSESSKRDIIESMDIHPDKIEVVYWGINHEIFYKQEVTNRVKENISAHFGINKPYFLSVSCNAERKNTHLLVEAYLKLSNQNPANDLVLVWNNPPHFVLKMIELGKMNQRVHFLSNISDHDLAMLYNGATSLIFPSSYEGFGLPVLEAMACGTPVVTCRNSSLSEIGADAPIYLDRPTVENILTILEKFENGGVDNNLMSQKGVKQAENFKWGKTAVQYLNIYKRFLEL